MSRDELWAGPLVYDFLAPPKSAPTLPFFAINAPPGFAAPGGVPGAAVLTDAAPAAFTGVAGNAAASYGFKNHGSVFSTLDTCTLRAWRDGLSRSKRPRLRSWRPAC